MKLRCGQSSMKRKDISSMNRKELVDLVYELVEDEGDGSSDISVEELKAEQQRIKKQGKYIKTLKSTLAVLIVVAAVAVLISVLFLPVIQVSGSSMEPTLCDGDILVLVKTGKFETGELCCFSWQNKLLLKRVIGKEGDYIDIDEYGNVSVNNIPIDEPYVTDKSLGICDITFPYQVPEGTIFVLGDKRDKSVDSRSTTIGCISKDQIIGKVLFKVWSGASQK